MACNVKIYLSLPLLIGLLSGQVTVGQSITIKVADKSGQPVQGMKVAAYTDNMCTQPVETNSRGIAQINTKAVRYLLVFDSDKGYAPAAENISYSSTTYEIGVDKRLTKQDASELVNTLISATSTAYDIGNLFAEVMGKAASSGPALGVPGVFSMTPAIKDGRLYMKVEGALIRQWQRVGAYYMRKNCPYKHEGNCVAPSRAV